MPHQCLQCGDVFPEGSRDILRGCPSCSGTKFFFTNSPLSGSDLETMRRSSEEEMRQLVRKVLTDGAVEQATPEDGPPTPEGWVAIRSDDGMEGRFKSVDDLKHKEGEVFERKVRVKRIKRTPKGPEVIKVLETGVYEIDLESLLKKDPIVIQKDGTYLIYLPSLFREG